MLGFWRPVLVMLSIFAVTITIVHTESVSTHGGQDQVYILSKFKIFTTSQKLRTGCVILLVAVLWTTEALPLEVSSLVPVVALPLLGVMDTGSVARWVMTRAKDSETRSTSGNTSPVPTCSFWQRWGWRPLPR